MLVKQKKHFVSCGRNKRNAYFCRICYDNRLQYSYFSISFQLCQFSKKTNKQKGAS